MGDEQYGIKITIPDKPADEQLEMVEDMRDVIKTLADMAGETPDLQPLDDVIAKLKAKIAVNDLKPLDQEAKSWSSKSQSKATLKKGEK